MATYYSNDFRSGLKIMLDGEPYAVESSEFVKPGKGQAFARVKLRRLLTGTRVEKTFKSTDSAEGADVVDMNLTYLYNDGEFWHFMNNETFEQLSADAKAIGSSAVRADWRSDQSRYPFRRIRIPRKIIYVIGKNGAAYAAPSYFSRLNDETLYRSCRAGSSYQHIINGM